MIEKFFSLKENKTNVRTEIIAGITTFMTMAYILAVNPGILSATGMDKEALFTATALSAVVGTLMMALVAKLPFALAPGMGLNAFFAFSVVIGMKFSWQFALTAVLLEGIIFILLTFLNVREAIINSIPLNMKHSVSAGIGLFIAFIGLHNAGIVVDNPATLVSLGNMADHGVWVALFGVLVTGVLLAKNVKGALLIGIIVSTIVGIPLGITNFSGVIDMPPSVEPIFFKFEFANIFSVDMLIILFTFLFVDMFDTVGTLVGVGSKADMLDKDGKLPRAKQALLADAVGTTVGACLGTSTVTTYVESASGVAEGGRTGLTSLVVAIMFILSLFFAPLFISIPGAATAPALIMVGLFMMSPIKKIDLNDYTEAIPAFLTIIMMPLTYSIAEGIVFGLLSYVILKVLSGKAKELHPLSYVLSVLFIIKFII
ncbi:MAG: NCS2 family permease [Candidatus Delongbacteria bacterium]|nr:NCS2 family permease [Candidatus Delongbacteria bacterium]MBN2836882.1 NCS2 family permease [Candidatus Delongbacteria bacterium]